MSGPEIVYLYSAGDRRHIADPSLVHPDDGLPVPYCNPTARYDTDEQMAAELRQWNPTEDVERAITRKRNRPICKRCQALAGPVTVRFYR